VEAGSDGRETVFTVRLPRNTSYGK